MDRMKWTVEAEALLRALTGGPRRADWVWIAKTLGCSIGATKAQYRMQHMTFEQLQRSSDQARPLLGSAMVLIKDDRHRRVMDRAEGGR